MPAKAHKKIDTGLAKRLSTNRRCRLALLWLSATLVLYSFFFSQALSHANYDEAFPGELLFILGMHALTGLLIATVVYVVGRRFSLATKLAMVVIIAWLAVSYNDRFMMFVGLLRALSPSLVPSGQDTPFLSLLFMAGLLALVYLAGRGLEKLQKRYPTVVESRNLAYGILVIIGVLFFGQGIRAVSVMAEILPQSRTVASGLGRPVKAATAKPDIYYFVLDRYTNNSVLKEQFGYDNSAFTDFLKDKGFTVNESASANYPFTDVSVSSTLAANYTDQLVAPYTNDKVQSHTLFHNIIGQSPVIKALKDQGYRYYNLGSWYNATNKAPLADVDYPSEREIFVFGQSTKRLRNLESLQFSESPYYSLLKSGFSWWPTRVDELPAEHLALSQLENLNKLAESGSQGGRFIMAHLLITHPPYFFNADGSISPYVDANNYGKPAKQKYVDTIKYANDQMEAIVTKALDKSGGQAVFIFSSDEGPFPGDIYPGNPLAIYPTNSHSMDNWPDDWLRLKFGILQAARIPEASADQLAHMSSVNMFRLVLNSYLGYNLDYLPQCHLTVGKDTEFVRRDFTTRLGDKADDYCKALLKPAK